MDTVTLKRCLNCKLQWVDDSRFESCPHCRRMHSSPPAAVVAGIEVKVEAVVLYGDEMGLHDSRVRRGLAGLELGERCECGYLSWRICPKCNAGPLT
jgi:hypothetical protein